MSEKWIVAVSGGPDSMALLDMVRKEELECIIAHVNYHMRDTSDQDMNLVSEYANRFGIPIEIKHFDPKTQKRNFQSEAREFRYNFFEELAKRYDAKGVLLAHHLDDDVETYLFQKERGMKSEFVGINKYSAYRTILLKRPLLSMRKSELVSYCESNNVSYAIDESNTDTKYTRNRIRQEIKDLDDSQWSQLIKEMYREKETWSKYQAKLNGVVSTWGESVSLDDFSNLNPRIDYLRLWMREKNIDVHSLTDVYLEQISDALLKGKGFFEFDDWILESSYGFIWLVEQNHIHDTYDQIKYESLEQYSLQSHGNRIEGVNLSENDFPIVIRNVEDGDSIALRFGNKKANRFFIDRKIPRAKRKNTLVIENSLKQVVFIVGLGSDVHHYSNNPNLFVIKL